MIVDTRYTGWGSKVTVMAPPADQVAKLTELTVGVDAKAFTTLLRAYRDRALITTPPPERFAPGWHRLAGASLAPRRTGSIRRPSELVERARRSSSRVFSPCWSRSRP